MQHDFTWNRTRNALARRELLLSRNGATEPVATGAAPVSRPEERHRVVAALAEVKNSSQSGGDELPSCFRHAAQVPEDRRGSGAHLQTKPGTGRAAFRFARVRHKRKGCGTHLQTDQKLFHAALRFAQVPPKPHRAVAALAEVKSSPQSGRDRLPPCSRCAAQVPGEGRLGLALL